MIPLRRGTNSLYLAREILLNKSTTAQKTRKTTIDKRVYLSHSSFITNVSNLQKLAIIVLFRLNNYSRVLADAETLFRYVGKLNRVYRI